MDKHLPRVSVGLPVYNGENYIREAIDSILAQTFEDFEFIICDNASTDSTQEICLEYAAKDNRIRYHRNEQNIGAARNQNLTMELATCEYFKMAAHDDIHAPTYLAKCVELLDQNPTAVLCHSLTRTIDEHGQPLEEQGDGTIIYNASWLRNPVRKLLNPILGIGTMQTNSPVPWVRFRSMACLPHNCYQIYAVIRTSALRKIPLMGNYGHADGVLLARLALLGEFCEVPEYLFFSRKHPEQSMSVYLKKNQSNQKGSVKAKDNEYDYRAYALWWDPANKGKLTFPTWKILLEFYKAIAESSVSLIDKLICFLQMFRWIRWNAKQLTAELKLAGQHLLHTASPLARRKQPIDGSM